MADQFRSVAVVLYQGFDELDAIGPYEVLSMARNECGVERLSQVSLDDAPQVTASHGTVVCPQGRLEGDWDLLVIPGGGWARRQGAFIEAERGGGVPAALAQRHAGGATVASVCTGAMLLAAAGLTRGRPATTHPIALDALRATGAEIVDARVVDDGDLVTAGGVTSGLDLGLWLVERMSGRELADNVARRLQYARVRDVHLGPRAGSGARQSTGR
jgi:transcriptional regulator GlxA family with amidase domain